MSPATISALSEVKAMTFDVFGTTVDWRSSVTEELYLRAFRKLSADLPSDLKAKLDRLTEEDWGRFAQAWRDSYGEFKRNFDAGRDEWKTVDEHHLDSLRELLNTWGLAGLYSEAETQSLSLVWHRLTPWPDAAEGLAQLGSTYTLSTLSNGNTSLLQDLKDFGGLGFHHLLCAETFYAYKPDPATYLGAARELGVEPHQLAMVAAHLSDLASARKHGLRTVYIERPQEEDWKETDERYAEAKKWVDLWITADEDGFLTLAQKLKEL
jgi:2-haloacid dehalogenase